MDGRSLAEFCAQKCFEKKAENVVILDLENLSTVADYFVICSGFSDRQVAAIADHVANEVRKEGVKPLSEEGLGDGRWCLIDCGTVIVHVFQDQLRDYYNLEGLWRDAPRIHVRDEASSGGRFDPDYNPGTASF